MLKKLLWPFLFINLLVVVAIMVSCNAPGCSWEKASDSIRGLSRHRASCRFYHRSRALASQKRQERMKAAKAASFVRSSSEIPQRGESSSSSSSVSGQFSTDIMSRAAQLLHNSRQRYYPFLTWSAIIVPNPFFRAIHQAGGLGLACLVPVQGVLSTWSSGSCTLILMMIITM
jgi:hypothetical protein